jgi:hypothetical protein
VRRRWGCRSGFLTPAPTLFGFKGGVSRLCRTARASAQCGGMGDTSKNFLERLTLVLAYSLDWQGHDPPA